MYIYTNSKVKVIETYLLSIKMCTFLPELK